MESTIKMPEIKPKYPCLMIDDDGLVVLFVGTSRGTVLRSARNNSTDYHVGRMETEWNISNFKLLQGTLTLKN